MGISKKQVLSIIVLLFMVLSSLSAIPSSHVNEQNNYITNQSLKNPTGINNQFQVNQNVHSTLFGFNSSSYGSSKYYDQSPEIAYMFGTEEKYGYTVDNDVISLEDRFMISTGKI